MQRLLAFGLLLAAAATRRVRRLRTELIDPRPEHRIFNRSVHAGIVSAFDAGDVVLAARPRTSASSCTGFSWQVTSQTSNSLAGTFSATCANGITASGTASGQVNGSDVPYTVTGTATVPGLPPCPFALSGTGHIVDSNTLLIPYIRHDLHRSAQR